MLVLFAAVAFGRAAHAAGRARTEHIAVKVSDSSSPMPFDASRVAVSDNGGKRDEVRAYDAAMALLHEKKYDEASNAFAGFLVRFPDHFLAGHAHYWRGECAYALGRFEQARELWRGGLVLFPRGIKAPDSWLKLAFASEKLGDSRTAQQASSVLLKEFSESAAAKLWRAREERSQSKGRSR